MPGMIKKEDIEKVRATADLYDIVSATVTLKPSVPTSSPILIPA